MISIVCINRHYDYKGIYSHIYLVKIDQIKRIIRIYDVRFYKGDFEVGDLLKDKIYKVTFDEIDKEKEDEEIVYISV